MALHSTYPDDLGLGPESETKLAIQLLATQTDVDRRVLFRLLGRPRRWREFRPLLEGRSEEVLNHSLRRLQGLQFIDKATMLEKGRKVETYEITQLGIRVFLRSQTLVDPVDRTKIVEAHIVTWFRENSEFLRATMVQKMLGPPEPAPETSRRSSRSHNSRGALEKAAQR